METRPLKRVAKVPYLGRANPIVLAVTMALVLSMAGIARAQQEVAPDRFDNLAQYLPASNVARKGSRRMTKMARHRLGLTARARLQGQGPGRKAS
jgi:hypothetical protein